jgi:hypothetical protein
MFFIGQMYGCLVSYHVVGGGLEVAGGPLLSRMQWRAATHAPVDVLGPRGSPEKTDT